MKILIISRYPPFPGGRENFVFELVHQLSKDNEIMVLTPDIDSGKTPNLEILRYPDSGEKLLNIIQNFEPNVVNSHTFYLSKDAMSIANELNIPFGITLHGDQFAIGDIDRQKMVSDIVISSDFVINVSENGRNSIVKNVGGVDGRKLRVIKNGVNLKRFKKVDKTQSRNRLDINEDKTVILTPTRIAPYKGIEFLVDSVTSNKAMALENNLIFLISIPDYPFSENEKTQYEEIKTKIEKEGVGQLIKFISLKYDDIHIAYSATDYFLLPSEKEQFPISILEAMASKLPIIATRVGGIPELLSNGKDALLVDFGDTDGLSESITRIISSDQDELVVNAFDKASKEYSIETVSNKYMELYKSILKL